MNLRKYYQEVSEARSKLETAFVYLTSVDTPNGGKAGAVCEAEADIAARMLVDGVARLSTQDEIDAFLEEQRQFRLDAEEEQLRNRLRVTLVSEPKFETGLRAEEVHERPGAKPKNRG